MAVGAELVVQRLAYAALDALRFAVPLDLCAYLHVVADEGPQLYLRAPDLSSMSATQAFDVFTALRDAVDGRATEATTGAARCVIGGFQAVAIRSEGAESKGVFVVGRRDVTISDDELEVIEAMCSAMGEACHTVEASNAGAPVAAAPSRRELSGVGIRIDDGVAHANVSFVVGDGSVTRGAGQAPATTEAVALATLDALADGWKLGAVAEGLVGDERVMIALVRDDNDRIALGVALVGGDAVRAAAEATAAATNR